MTKDVLAKAFEPFFTTKEIGKGSGLGLSQALGFAKQSGGGMRIESRLGEGTSVKVYLPRTTEHDVSAASSNTAAAVQRPSKGGIILLVDDDEAVREITATMLRTSGYVVLEVGSGRAALDLLDGGTNIDLAILDFAMPGMNGVEVARQIHARFPHLPVLFVTGYVDQSVLAEIDESRIVKKPFIGEELTTKVNAAILNANPRSSGKVLPLRR
jgi:CheY-like chemotaxis protein